MEDKRKSKIIQSDIDFNTCYDHSDERDQQNYILKSIFSSFVSNKVRDTDYISFDQILRK